MRTTLFAFVFALLGVVPTAYAGSETPPEGPPWKRDLVEAHKQASSDGKPIFLYFTKTY